MAQRVPRSAVTPPRATCRSTAASGGTRAGGENAHAEGPLAAHLVLDRAPLDGGQRPCPARRAKCFRPLSGGVRRSGGARPTAAVFGGACDKYIEHQPIERQCVRFARSGVEIRRRPW